MNNAVRRGACVVLVGAVMALGTVSCGGSRWEARQNRWAHEAYRGLKTLRSPEGAFGFPVDNTGEGGHTYTKSTNIGLDILSTLTAVARGEEDPARGRAHIERVVEGLGHLQRHRGLFPEYIHLFPHGVAADAAGGRIRYSSIDSAWLHFALSVGADHFRDLAPELSRAMDRFVAEADYSLFLNEDGTLFRHGVTVSADDDRVIDEWEHHYDNKNSEARLLVAFLTAAGKLPVSVWDRMTYAWTEVEGLPLADGWKLSAFVELTGRIYFDEGRLAPASLGVSHAHYVTASRRVALREGYRLYGWAPCYNPEDRYQEYGLRDTAVVTPYAAALLTTVDDHRALRNFAEFVQMVPSSSGVRVYPDALDPRTGAVLNRRVLSLNQNLLYHALAARDVRRVVARVGWHGEACRLLETMDERHRPPDAVGRR